MSSNATLWGVFFKKTQLLYKCSEFFYEYIEHIFFLENLPSLDFSGHCGDNVLSSEEDLTSYLKCPNIEKDIKYCQTKGIKIFLDIRMTTGFQSKKMAIQFADQVWGLFLGGNFAEKWRTFGR